jgi:hypothetical protein
MHRRAVFTRNHEEYLEEACKREEPTAFQSKKKWSGAEGWLKKQGTLKVYIAPIAPVGDPKVMYEGTITQIALVDTAPEATIKKLLAARGEKTKKEGRWGKTVYLLSDCRPIIPAVSLSALQKARDETPLSDDYKYSYSIVLERVAPAVA